MKIIVYAICKNEEQFVDRWFNSMKEADDICVLDTGSTDQTVNKLIKYGVHVKTKIINPWRFDVARNESLKLVPLDADVCVCTDLDEVFNTGWRKEIEKNWLENTTRASYTYNWNLDENNKPIITFFIEKIHSRNSYKWIYPVHEILSCTSNENKISIPSIILNHYPDAKKSRSSYLPLLELSVKENPENDRNMHYLGREYMYYGLYQKAIDTLIKHLHLKKALWKDERCASMRFIARSYKMIHRYDEAKMWLNKAIKEAPYLRDPFVEMAILYYELNDYKNVIKYCKKALKIKIHTKTYINEAFSWNNTIYDIMSISNFYLGHYSCAIKYCKLALDMDRNNERLNQNLLLFKKTRQE